MDCSCLWRRSTFCSETANLEECCYILGGYQEYKELCFYSGVPNCSVWSRRGRRNIRRVLDDKELDEKTKSLLALEKVRKQHSIRLQTSSWPRFGGNVISSYLAAPLSIRKVIWSQWGQSWVASICPSSSLCIDLQLNGAWIWRIFKAYSKASVILFCRNEHLLCKKDVSPIQQLNFVSCWLIHIIP